MNLRVLPACFLIAADADIRPQLLRGAKHPLQRLGMNPVIVVVKKDPLAVRVLVHPVQPGVSCHADALIFLVNHVNPGVFFRIAVADLPAVVRAAVVHQNQLQIPEGLIQNSFDTPGQILRHFIYRHNHADLCHGKAPFQVVSIKDSNISSISFTMRFPLKNTLRFSAPAFSFA